jgi:hypothetical protein
VMRLLAATACQGLTKRGTRSKPELKHTET